VRAVRARAFSGISCNRYVRRRRRRRKLGSKSIRRQFPHFTKPTTLFAPKETSGNGIPRLVTNDTTDDVNWSTLLMSPFNYLDDGFNCTVSRTCLFGITQQFGRIVSSEYSYT
jgi:hypothetical protein